MEFESLPRTTEMETEGQCKTLHFNRHIRRYPCMGPLQHSPTLSNTLQHTLQHTPARERTYAQTHTHVLSILFFLSLDVWFAHSHVSCHTRSLLRTHSLSCSLPLYTHTRSVSTHARSLIVCKGQGLNEYIYTASTL